MTTSVKGINQSRNPSTRESAVESKATAAKLIAAAAREFNTLGFAGTDTNKIAHRAGFAPQTFYRWFRDKTAIFVAVYRAWEDEERSVLAALLAEQAAPRRLVDAIVEHHRKYRIFRRSLRRLSLEDPVIRKARAESRHRQIERIRKSLGPPAPKTEQIAAMLFQIERLSDAIADDEFADLGIEDKTPRAAIEELLGRLRR